MCAHPDFVTYLVTLWVELTVTYMPVDPLRDPVETAM